MAVGLTRRRCGYPSIVDTNAYLTFLLLGAGLIVVDGQIIYRSGRKMLRQSGSDPGAAESQTKLIVVLFHLISFGVLAIGSTIDTDSWGSATGVVARLGFLLLFLAAAHWTATAVLGNMREREAARARRLARDREREVGGAELGEPPITPVPGQPGADPWVSPSLEDRELGRPYS